MIAGIIVWIGFFGVAAAIVASNRGGNGFLWFVMGLIFGPLGLACAYFNGKTCPFCRWRINNNTVVCPKCQSDLSSSEKFKDREEGWALFAQVFWFLVALAITAWFVIGTLNLS
jgi:hypothetical protein